MALSVAQWHIRAATGPRLTGSKSASRKPATKKTGKRSRLPRRRRGNKGTVCGLAGSENRAGPPPAHIPLISSGEMKHRIFMVVLVIAIVLATTGWLYALGWV